MTNICAAIGVSQLQESQSIINQKRKIFEKYSKKIKFTSKIRILKESKNVSSSYWLIVIVLKNKTIKNKLEKFLSKNYIETRPTFYPIHKLPIYYSNKKFKNAEILGTCGLCLPSYPGIKNSEIEYISKKINQFFDEIK